MPARIFFSYSSKDEALRHELEEHLEVLQSNGTLTTWHVHKLEPGADGRAVLEREIEAADIVLLLVSADFLASEYKGGAEVRRALERHAEGTVRVVPVVLRPCLWDEAAFGHLASLPSGGQPVTLWQNRDEAWLDIVSGILALVRRESRPRVSELTPTPSPSRPRGESRTPTPLSRPEVGLWLRELESAQAQKDAAIRRGDDVRAILARIDELKRRLREGGQLQQNDSLGDGRYFLLRPIGRGGFATVWEADDRAEGKRVAIKVLHPQLAADPVRCERFFRGARAMARLDHPNVVRVLVPYEEDAGFFYFVMELLPGGDLHRAVRQGRVPRSKVVPLILEVGEALALAHEAGFVHRDVSPHNILIGPGGEAKLSDFDLVTAEGTTGGTRTGAMGKFIYTAPEVMSRPQDADARADVYSLGMTAIFCWHGADLPTKVLRKPEQLVAKLDCGSLAPVLQKAIEWDADDRYPNARAFCHALRAAADRPPERPLPERMPALVPEARLPVQLATFQQSPPRGRQQSRTALWMWGALLAMVASGIVAAKVWAVKLWPGAEHQVLLPVGHPEPLPVSSGSATVRITPPQTSAKEEGQALARPTSAMTSVPAPRGVNVSRAAAKPSRCPKDMVLVAAGTFRMGAEHGEESTTFERPAHDVKMSSFCIDKTEVTVAAYQECTKAKKCDDAPMKTCNGVQQGLGDHPINCVDWRMADLYCKWAGRQLPSEAQWEYAARGTKGQRRKYPWGDREPSAELLNAHCSGCGKLNGTAPVTEYEAGATPEGVLNMAGNVAEWVRDMSVNYKASGPPPTDPVTVGPTNANNGLRIVRGSAWTTDALNRVRTTYRRSHGMGERHDWLGFRCALELK